MDELCLNELCVDKVSRVSLIKLSVLKLCKSELCVYKLFVSKRTEAGLGEVGYKKNYLGKCHSVSGQNHVFFLVIFSKLFENFRFWSSRF